MTVAIRSEELEKGEESAVADTMRNAEIVALVNGAVKGAIAQEVAVLEATSKALLDSFRIEIAGYAKPKSQILSVEVNGERRKLSKKASPLLADLLINAQIGLNSLIVGPAGCGKSTVAHQVAEALGLDFGQICCSAGASESWLFGRQTANGFVEAPFSRIYKTGGVFLLDEIDAADANMLLAINTAIANGHMANPILGEIYTKHEKFVLIAAANTFGKGGNAVYTGRSRLDGATLNRFAGSIFEMQYDVDLESELCPDKPLYDRLQSVRKKLLGMGSNEIISTRHFENAFKLKQAGVEPMAVLKRIGTGWPSDLIGQTGLLDPLEAKRERKDVAAVAAEAKPVTGMAMMHRGKRYGSATPCKTCKSLYREHQFTETQGVVIAMCPEAKGEFIDGSNYGR